MTAPRLSTRDRRALWLGTLVLAPALFVAFVGRPFASALLDRRERVRVERDLLERELALVADARAFPEALTAAEAALFEAAPRLFAGADPFAGVGALEGHVLDRAREHRVFVQRTEPLGPEVAGAGVVSLRLAFRALGDLNGVLGFLRALEAGPKLVRIDRIAIERIEDFAAGVDQVVLAITAEVRGFAIAGTGAGPAVGSGATSAALPVAGSAAGARGAAAAAVARRPR